MVAIEDLSMGDGMEAYWPDDDMWLPATLTAVQADGRHSIVWEDGSASEVAADYVRRVSESEDEGMAEGHMEAWPAEGSDRNGGETESNEGEVIEDDAEKGARCEGDEAAEKFAPSPSDDTDMDVLLAAAAAAGALDDADEFVAGSKPPCQMHWAKVLMPGAAPVGDEIVSERKRCRPHGLMTSAQATELALSLKKAKRWSPCS